MFVLTEDLKDQAALYAAGALTAQERAQFDLVLEFHDEARDFTRGLEEIAALTCAAPIATCPVQPSANLKDRILSILPDRVQQAGGEGFVMAGPNGLFQWANDAFFAMCGYSYRELAGKKPGPILQGPLTDPAAVTRIRTAVTEHKPVTETLVNYHKNGTPYWVCLNITPIFRADGDLLWFVARERELPELSIPA